MRIAVIGWGSIGRTLGEAWARAGHEVVAGVRDPGAIEVPAGIGVGDVAGALAGADAALLAVPGPAVGEVLDANGRLLEGIVLLDAANDVGGPTLNQLDLIHERAPGAHAFRAFNTLGFENFADPVVGGVQADLVFCGPDGAPREIAERLIADAGLRPVYAGGPEAVGVVDGVARLWFALALGQGRGRRLAFKVLEG